MTEHPPTAPTAEQLAEQYAKHVAEALALPDNDYPPCRVDLAVVLSQLQAGLAALEPHRGSVLARAPELREEDLRTLPGLCMAAMHAAALYDTGPNRLAERTTRLARARELREPMLLCCEALALLGLLSREEIAGIRAGTGAYDLGQDLLALVAQFRAHEAALAHKHPFSAAYLAEAEELGQWVVTHVTPAGALPPEDRSRRLRAAERDRLWFLVLQRFETLWRAAVVQWGTGAEEHVRPLQARTHHAPRRSFFASTPPPPPEPAK